jgi:hypothetical protein
MSFTRVTKQNPCPICRKAGLRGIDWCRVFADGWAECMRVQSSRSAKSGGWMHRIDGPPRRYSPAPPKPAVPTINATKLMREWLAATAPAALADFAGSLGVSMASLAAVGAAWSAQHAAWAFPMCDGHGNVVGIRLRNEHGKFAVRGSRQGIFAANVPPQKTLFVCEGPTDTAAAVELGLFAVGRPNCCCGGPEIKIYARRHECSRVVVVSDNDKPGLDGARKVGAELKLPFAIYVPPAKDVREFVRLGGTRAMIENTLKSTLWNP